VGGRRLDDFASRHGAETGDTTATSWRGRRWLLLQALSLVGLILVLYVGHVAASDGFAYDAHAYWAAQGYGIVENAPDAFVYSPPVLLVCRVLGQLPWLIFLELYTAAIAVGTWILAGPVTVFLVFTPPVASEITLANIHVFLALVAVFGLRWPALWSFALMTKVTPGVGILWFAFRGEWRKLWIALGVTAAIAVPTMILAPGLWADWIGILTAGSRQTDGGPLVIRLPIAVALVWLGAKRDWPWLVPVASMLALPILWSIHGLSMLLGVVWWARRSLKTRPHQTPAHLTA
jgi:Glycosyltransferase family 87